MDFTPETYIPAGRYKQLVEDLQRVVRQEPLDLETAIVWTLAETAGLLPDTARPAEIAAAAQGEVDAE